MPEIGVAAEVRNFPGVVFSKIPHFSGIFSKMPPPYFKNTTPGKLRTPEAGQARGPTMDFILQRIQACYTMKEI